MRYSDTELWKITEKELNEIKTTKTFNEFCLWSIERLTVLIDASTRQDNWMEPEVKFLRNYRIKARDRFFLPKLVKEK